ncbi:metallophosphoesterase [Parendozoicomonas haliclonae]|uniref:Bis(5'-nucleosyl)-tetraphosphatase PrpE [asymmetrical] n=1 Tax=Parendozoicomonas haliclonae TaxID=1960125 RepID=A0A1X7ARG2_9GAMM|nr:metallophosphoesterase [Parendozoicomonas haliclonae]SMA50825.1 Bis(5'-nucleosyl)-tetraphosphatase PrpE [asymmetrical] [Parendozoicomonas haliclonae]
MYDIIGDIHGQADELEQLLKKLGYQHNGTAYRHPERRVIFVGDFIDGGRQQHRVVEISRAMVESGTALAVIGNHEFNAICYATPADNGDYLRSHTKPKNTRDHQEFLDEFPFGSPEHQEVIGWFRTLPLFLDLGDLRIIHAVWHHPSFDAVEDWLDENNCLIPEAYRMASDPNDSLFDAVEHLLKGIEVELPEGYHFFDKKQNRRTAARIRWWDEQATHWNNATVGTGKASLPDQPLPSDIYRYRDAVPLFVGHYWLKDTPEVLADNVACVDYSVARVGGKLTAYRWSGEKQLRSENFVWVERTQ